MSIKKTSGHKVSSLTVVVSVVLFVFLLLTIPYYLTQLADKNATELNAKYFADNSFNMGLEEILALPDELWEAQTQANLGLVSEPYWFKLSIPASNNKHKQRLLVNYGLLDNVDVWFLDPSLASKEVLSAYATGDSYPFEHRVVKSEQFLFEVPEYNSDILVILRIKSKGPMKVPIELWEEKAFTEYLGLYKLFMGIFYGYMLAMSVCNLFLYASSKNIIFAIYTGYVTSIALAVASLHGVGFHYIWPNSLWIQEFSVFLCTNFTLIFIISLSTRLLQLEKTAPKTFRLLVNIRYIFIALLLLSLFAPYEIMIKAVLVLMIITTPIILTAGIMLAMTGNVVARYFCAAWAALLLSGTSIALENFGIYRPAIESIYLIMVGAITESLLLAFALAVSFSNQLKDAIKTRQTALDNEQEALDARDQLISLQEKNKKDLEYSIEERTLELEVALRELAEKNSDLERLSAIDPLTGLMNRRYFDKRLLAESRRSKRELTPLGLAMLDIDHFKGINDEYGHLCGDHCLKVFAELIKEHVKRPSDIACRYGGEEFVLILPNTDEEGLLKLLEKIRMAVANKKIMFEGHEISMTVSIGGSSRIMASEDEHELIIAYVDKKLYQAKNAGRNTVLVESY